MNTQTQPTPNQKPVNELPEHRKLIGIILLQSSRFNSSETITKTGSLISGSGANCSIEPARLLSSGDWRPTTGDETPTGVGVSQIKGTGKDRYVSRGYFPMAAIAEFLYAA